MTPAVFLLLPVLLAAFITFDLLVYREYTAHRDHWMRDGRPLGFVWRPPAADCPGWWARSGWSLARVRVSLVWLFHTPWWVRDDLSAWRLLWLLRLSVLVWNSGVLVAIAV